MCDVPLDLQRRFEQRWAARFAPRVVSATPKSIVLKAPVKILARSEEKESRPAKGCVNGREMRSIRVTN